MSGPFQGQQHFPAGHIFESAVGLSPIPFLAEDSGNGGTSLVPVFMDNGLNHRQIDICNGSVSDGNGQHGDCISERKKRRHHIMHV